MSSKPKIEDLLQTCTDGYKIHSLIGQGSYGAVYMAKRTSDGGRVAVKVESSTSKRKVLPLELALLTEAKTLKSSNFCEVLDSEEVTGAYSFLVMELCGKSLWDLRVEREDYRFSVGTAMKAALQTLSAIRHLHGMGFLHRDIKFANFADAADSSQLIRMLDFGLARRFRGRIGGLRHPRNAAPFRGTWQYASVSAMKGEEQSRKDSTCWWSSLLETSHGARSTTQVLKMKEEVAKGGKAQEKFLENSPRSQILHIPTHLKGLSYEDIPDYSCIRSCILDVLQEKKIKWNQPLDWNMEEYKVPQEEQ